MVLLDKIIGIVYNMSMARRLWTAEEEALLVSSLQDSYDSISDLSRHLSTQLPGRTPHAVDKKLRVLQQQHKVATTPHPQPEFTNLLKPEMDIDEWIEQLSSIQDLRLKAEPHTTVAEVKIKTGGRPIGFVPTSCWHLGGLYTNHREFRERFQEVLAIDRLYWGTHGDEWENFPPGWGMTVYINLMPPHLQRQLVAKIVDKLHEAGSLLYSCWSNHPAFTERLTGEDPSAAIYMDKIPYFRGKGILKLSVDEQMYIMSLAHKLPGASIHNPTHSQGRQLGQVPQADFVIEGHRHSYAYQEQAHRLESYDAGLQQNRVAHLVQVGTAKDGPDPYTMRSWSRGEFTWPCFVLSATQHEIHRVYDTDALKWYLARKDF